MLRLATLMLAACADKDGGSDYAEYEVGSAAACLTIDDESAIQEGESVTYDVVGTVVSDGEGTTSGNAHPCGEVARVLSLTDSEGRSVELGYGIRSPEGADLTPPLEVEAGDTVYLEFASVRSFGEASGFVLQDTAGVLGAIEVGTWGPALQEGAFPGLSVRVGETVGSGLNACGTTAAYEIVFEGDAARALTPVEDKLITVAARSYTAYALAAWEYTEATCTDVAGATVWSVFR